MEIDLLCCKVNNWIVHRKIQQIQVLRARQNEGREICCAIK